MKNPIQPKMKAVGIGGIGVMIVMALMDQLAPGIVDFSKEVMGVSLGNLLIVASTFVAGWFKAN